LPTPDSSYKRPSFKNPKPDVNHVCGKTGALCISSFGDLKKVGLGDFSHDEQGHVLDMATTFMDMNPFRPFVVVFLSEGRRWKFFRVIHKTKDSFSVIQKPVVNDATEGWQLYLALLSSSLEDLGHHVPAVTGFKLEEMLGRGMSCMVYKGKEENNESEESMLIRFYFQGDTFDTEKRALPHLQGVEGVPKICKEVAVQGYQGGVVSMHEHALIVTLLEI
jgi:hypothetical protein